MFFPQFANLLSNFGLESQKFHGSSRMEILEELTMI